MGLREPSRHTLDRCCVFGHALRRAGLKGELYCVKKKTRHVSFADERVSSSGTSIDNGISLRVIEDGCWGYSSATGWDEVDADELVEYAKASARMSNEHASSAPCLTPLRNSSTNLIHPDFSRLTLTEMIHFGAACVDCAKQIDPALRLNFRLETTSRVIGFVDVDENHSEFTHALCHIQMKAACPGGNGYLVSHQDFYTGALTAHDPVLLVQGCIAPLQFVEHQASRDSGRMNVMLMPNAFAMVLSSLTCLWNGQCYVDGLSPFCGRVGEKISNAGITLRDNGTLPHGRWSCAFDAQGTPAQDTPLVQEGVLSGFFHDRQSGHLSGGRSTGNARCDFVERPHLDVSNLIIEPGHHSWEDALRLMGDGLLVYELLQGSITNVLVGDFAAKVMLGYRVHDGELVGRLDESTTIRGNLVESLWNMIALGNLIQPWRWYYTPFVVIEGLTVMADA